MSTDFWLGFIVGIAACVILAFALYVGYQLWLGRIERAWNDPMDAGAPPARGPYQPRDPLSPPSSPQAPDDEYGGPRIADMRWTRGWPSRGRPGED